jgi:hypothetical protein
MKYTDYVGECCQVFTERAEVPGDLILTYFIRLQRLMEDVDSTFDYDDNQNLPTMDASRIEILVKTFNRQLVQIKESFTPEAWNNSAITLKFYNLRIFIHEIGLHSGDSEPTDSSIGGDSCRSWFSAMARTDALITCLDATKDYLDRYLSLPLVQMRENTVLEESKVIYALLVLGKFVSGVNSPHLDPLALRKRANIEHYMVTLVERMDELITVVDGQEQRNYFWHVKTLFQNSRQWYQQQVRDNSFPMLESDGLPTCMDLSMLDVLTYAKDMDGGLTPSDTNTNSSWASMSATEWPQPMPLVAPLMMKESSSGVPQGNPGELWSGFFDDFPMTMDPAALDFDYTVLVNEDLVGVRGALENS